MTISKNHSLIRKIVEGYEEIEPCIMSALALKRNIFFIGAHGIGKTTLGKLLGRAADESGKGFRFYDAAKANIMSIGGLPDLDKSRQTGKMEFINTDLNIFGAKIVIADELPRADKERQNYWLEIAEEGTFQGIPVGMDMLIATGNDSTYHGNFKMDLALKSRFIYVLPAPAFKTVESQDVIDMIKLNIGARKSYAETAREIRALVGEMREKIKVFEEDQNLIDQLSIFIGTYVQFLKEKIANNKDLADNPESYIPPREFANQMIYSILGLYAYFSVKGMPNPLQQAGYYTVKYVIESRHAAAGPDLLNTCSMAWKQLQNMLVGNIDSPEGRIKFAFASAMTPAQKIGFFSARLDDIIKTLNDVDLTNMTGDTFQDIRQNDIRQIAPFYALMAKNQRTEHVSRECEGFVLTEVVRKLMAGKANATAESPESKMYNKYGVSIKLDAHEVSEIIGA